MLSNLIPALILIPLLNWLVPWFITNFDLWGKGIKSLSLITITSIVFILFSFDIPISIFHDYAFIKHWAGEEIYIFNPAELFFSQTVGISLLIIFLELLSAKKAKWFLSFIGMILLAFSLHIVAVQIYLQHSLSNDSSRTALNTPKLSLPFTAEYLVLRLVGKAGNIGETALKEQNINLWRRYLYLENKLYSENDISAELTQALKMKSSDYIEVIKQERGYDSDMIEALKAYNTE